ncbi:MAG TPA: TetR/AcrR family transcriptional regulator [Solirubrobacteraceae bacterium]|jgi:AcrR family transcriptional regulator
MSSEDRVGRAGGGRRDRGRPGRPLGAHWDPAALPRRAPRPAVSREAIVRAGLDIVDTEGIDALSMRKVAQALGIGTMTLYTHVANKDELLDLMDDEVMGEVLLPGAVPEDWREALTEIGRRTAQALLDHEWVAAAMHRRPLPGPNALMHVEQSLAAVEPLGLDAATAGEVLSIVDDYVMGFALRTIASRQWRWEEGEAPSPVMGEQPAYLRRLLQSGDFPRLWKATADNGFEPPREDRFERGLQWLLDGIEAALARGR